MKVGLSWLNTLCDAGLAPAALAERLTRQGLETGIPLPVTAPAEQIVAASFADVTPIPRTNYQRIEADAGAAGHFAVVSAAPNVARGMVGALALPDATLPDGRVIAARKYAGVPSEAMLCSAAELGLGEVSDRLLELPSDAKPGVPLAALYGLPDHCLEIELTPNRGDCLSMIGIAREVHASSRAPLRLPAIEAVAPAHQERVEVRVEQSEACPRYLGRVIAKVNTQAKTPLWLAERLRRAGQRPGHPLVDVLNYVMLELGQPLHAFDRAAIAGAIRVRPAREGETLTLLNGATATLAVDMLVIADDKNPLALAGIMGGAASAVTADTTEVFLESAWFAPAAIRGRARRLGLATEAAQRYERGVDPELARAALERASALIGEITGGTPGPVIAVEAVEHLPQRPTIEFHPATLPRLLGLELDEEEIERILAGLGFALKRKDGAILVTPPSARFDIENESDLAEEIARIAGFERIPAVAPRRRLALPRAPRQDELSARLATLLIARGYDEAVTMSFVAPDRDAALAPAGSAELVIANPLSERESVLRRSLWPGLLGALAHNAARQAERVRLFESGAVFDARAGEAMRFAAVVCGAAAPEQWGRARRDADFYDLKGEVETLLAAAGVPAPAFEPTTRAGLAPGRAARAVIEGKVLAEFGVLASELAARWDLPAGTLMLELDLDALERPVVVRARPVPRFPAVRRDLALIVPAGVSAAQLLAVARKHGGERLAQPRIFDLYTGPGIPEDSRGVGLGLIFRDFSRTLTDAEVDAAVSAIVTGLAEEAGVHVRS
ncbi:MAG: phenylalanine--tRNA ligase subunit beta [Gammaproteobacteria bacterium]